MKVPTDAEASAQMLMINMQYGGDEEAAHSLADDYLCSLLVSLGYEKTVEEYYKIEKWYA